MAPWRPRKAAKAAERAEKKKVKKLTVAVEEPAIDHFVIARELSGTLEQPSR